MDWPAQRFDSTNKCYDNSYLQKGENRAIMPGQELRSQDARLEKEQTNFGGDADLPSKATDKFKERWDAARRLAAQLQSRGVDAGQVYILLNALLPSGWDSDAGIYLGGMQQPGFFAQWACSVLPFSPPYSCTVWLRPNPARLLNEGEQRWHCFGQTRLVNRPLY